MSERRKRGFAAMNPEKQRAIAQKGGQAAHGKGTAHEFSPEEARRAGHLGGKAVSANRAHMAAIGRKGGTSVQGLSTARARAQSPATRTVRDTLPPPDASSSLLTQIRADHQKINGLFHQYEVDAHTQEMHPPVLLQICQELLHHMELEEAKIYPLIRQALPESEQLLIESSLREHKRIKELVQQVEGHTAQDTGIRELFYELQTCVRQHVQKEEHEVLPKAEELLSSNLRQFGQETPLEVRNTELPLPVEQYPQLVNEQRGDEDDPPRGS